MNPVASGLAEAPHLLQNLSEGEISLPHTGQLIQLSQK